MLLVEFFPGFNPFFIGARIVNGGKAVGEEFILGQEDDFLKLLFSVGRNGLVKRFLGLGRPACADTRRLPDQECHL